MYLSCFKYIRNVYDSVKFLSNVMFFFQPWAVLAVCDRSDRSEGTGLTGPSACWLMWTGLTGPRDRSDRSVAAALLLCLLVCVT